MENSKQQKQNKMEATPVFKLIISMSLPAMFSMLVQAMYNIVDSFFVSKIGSHAFTAVSLAFPIQMLIIAFAVGTGIGLNSLISRRLGAKKFDEANIAATHGIFLGFATGIVFAILGLLFVKPFFAMFTQDAEIFSMGCRYTYIVTIFSFITFIQIFNEKILQSTGNMIYPMIMQLAGAITNIILDPIFIFGLFGVPAMGITGAAVATMIGQLVGMALGIYFLVAKEKQVHVSFKNFKPNKAIIKDIYTVGLPSIVMQSIASILITGLNSILMKFSASAVNVLGIYYKIQSFIFMPIFGLCQGLLPIMGYNYGAQNKKRVLSTLRYGTFIGLVIMSLGTIIFMTIPEKLLSIFNATPEVYEIGVPALRIISTCFIGAAIGIVFSSAFQAMGNGFYSLLVSVLRQAVIIFPFAFIASKYIGVTGVWLSFPVSEYISVIISITMMIRLYNNKIKHMADNSVDEL